MAWGALLKTALSGAGKLLKTAGRGLKRVGKGLFHFLGGTRFKNFAKRNLANIKTKLNPKNWWSKIKKATSKVGQYFGYDSQGRPTPKKIPQSLKQSKKDKTSPNNPSVFKQLRKEMPRMSLTDSNDELISEFHLSEEERRDLLSYPSPSPSVIDLPPAVPAQNESSDAQKDYMDVESPVENAVSVHAESIDPQLSYSIITPAGSSAPTENQDSNESQDVVTPVVTNVVIPVQIAKTQPDERQVLVEYLGNPDAPKILQDLNSRYDEMKMIQLEDRQVTLKYINEVVKKLMENRYYFLNFDLSTKEAIYKMTENHLQDTKVLKALASYLISKDGDTLRKQMQASNQALSAILTMQEAQNVMLQQNTVLSAESNTQNTQMSEHLAEEIQKSAEGTTEAIEQSTSTTADAVAQTESTLQSTQGNLTKDLFSLIGAAKDYVVDFIKQKFELVVLLLLLIDELWSKIKAYFEGFSLAGIGDLIWGKLKRFAGTVWDLIKYWWMSVSLGALKSSEGELIWNGGDYYFKYSQAQEDGTIYEKPNYSDTDEKIVQRFNDQGEVTSVTIDDTTYDSQGRVQQDNSGWLGLGGDNYTIDVDENGLKTIEAKSEFILNAEVPCQNPEYMVGKIHPAPGIMYKGAQVYFLGGPGTVYADYMTDKDDGPYEENYAEAAKHSYVYIAQDSAGTWVALPPSVLKDAEGMNQTYLNLTHEDAAYLFNQLKQGNNVMENFTGYHDASGNKIDSLVTTGMGDTMASTINNFLDILTSAKDYKQEQIQEVKGQFHDAKVVNGELRGYTDVSNMIFLHDDNGLVTNMSNKLVNTANAVNANQLTYSQQNRASIFNGGNQADCSSYISYILYKSGINLSQIYKGIPTTDQYSELIRNTGAANSLKVQNTYSYSVVEKSQGGTPDESKLQPGDIAVFKTGGPGSEGHVIMYLGNHTWTHMGCNKVNGVCQPGGNRTFQYSSSWVGGKPYIGSIRFGKPSTKDLHGTTVETENEWYEGDLAADLAPDSEGAAPVPNNVDIALDDRTHADYRGINGNVCERSNNPGNIRGTGKGSQVRSYPGWVGITRSGSGDFSTFENQMWGIYAFYRLIATQYLPNGQNTIKSIFYKYCPPGDHGQGAPTAYIASVSRDTGLGENERIDAPKKELFQSLMKAVYKFEGGTKRAPMSQEDLDEAWNKFDTHFKGKTWPVVPTVDPQIYGSGGFSGGNSIFSGGSIPARQSYPEAQLAWEKDQVLADKRKDFYRRTLTDEEFRVMYGEEKYPDLTSGTPDMDVEGSDIPGMGTPGVETSTVGDVELSTDTSVDLATVSPNLNLDHSIEPNPDYKAPGSDTPLSSEGNDKGKKPDQTSTPTRPNPTVVNNYQTLNAPKPPDQFNIDPDAFMRTSNNKA